MQIFNSSLALSMINNMNRLNSRLSLLSMQIATGNRLVSASVDPAGFAIAEKMKAQISGLYMASRNAQDGISMMQTADGALSAGESIVQRIRELVVQASNDSYNADDRVLIQQEIGQLLQELGDFSQRTEFNNKKLFSGAYSENAGGVWIQTGANAGQGTMFYFNKIDLNTLGLNDFDITGKSGDQISDMLTTVDKALGIFTSERARIGAYENRLEYTIKYLDQAAENLSSAHSRIADVDMAKAMMEYTKTQIQMQVSMAMLSNLFYHERMMMSLLLSSLPVYHNRPPWF